MRTVREQTGKRKAIRRVAVRESSVYRHNRGVIKGSIKPLNTIVFWWSAGFRGPSIGLPWCRETLVSRTAIRQIAVVLPVQVPGIQVVTCTEKTSIPFPFKGNGIWSWWQFSFRFEPNGIPFGSISKGNLSAWSYHIQYERKWNTSCLSVVAKRRADISE